MTNPVAIEVVWLCPVAWLAACSDRDDHGALRPRNRDTETSLLHAIWL